jgi:hypothetical protein
MMWAPKMRSRKTGVELVRGSIDELGLNLETRRKDPEQQEIGNPRFSSCDPDSWTLRHAAAYANESASFWQSQMGFWPEIANLSAEDNSNSSVFGVFLGQPVRRDNQLLFRIPPAASADLMR